MLPLYSDDKGWAPIFIYICYCANGGAKITIVSVYDSHGIFYCVPFGLLSYLLVQWHGYHCPAASDVYWFEFVMTGTLQQGMQEVFSLLHRAVESGNTATYLNATQTSFLQVGTYNSGRDTK